MPANLTFPGVYIQEIPSGVHTITGVATSITAFIGAAQRGADNKAVTITSFGDFERIFGGVWVKSYLGHAVRDFFLNGGSQAIIVRLVQTETIAAVPGAKAAEIDLHTGAVAPNNNLTLVAASKGKWGNNLRAFVDYDTKDTSDTKLFNLTIFEADPTAPATDPIAKQAVNLEKFLNVSIDDTSPRYIPRVLRDNSQFVRVNFKPGALPTDFDPWVVPTVRPSETPKVNGQPSPVVVVTQEGFDGGPLTVGLFTTAPPKHGINALDDADLFNILCIPPYDDSGDVSPVVLAAAAQYCLDRRAMLLVDPQQGWTDVKAAQDGTAAIVANIGSNSAKNAAIFFPRLKQPNSLHNNQIEEFVPCGAVAGIFARTDTQRGVWKAPAGLDATLVGVPQLSVKLTDLENGLLNPLGINCLRSFPATGRVVWGSRTLQGNDNLSSEWKYIPVRRTALYIEESLYRGTQWVVFEPNDEPLWAQIRLNVGAFMQNLFRQGAFQGQSPRDAYFVKCDKETTTQNDINLGIVNIVVGFAPLKPAEFVVIKLQQIAGQIAV
jgi:uncharacterized protein